MVTHAALKNFRALGFASSALLADRAFLLGLAGSTKKVRLVAEIAKVCSNALRDDEDFNVTLLSLSQSPSYVIKSMRPDFLEREPFMTKAVRLDWRLLGEARGAAAQSDVVAREAVKKNRLALNSIKEPLRSRVESSMQAPAPSNASLRELLRSVETRELDVVRQVTCPVCYDLLYQNNTAMQCPNGHLLCRTCLEDTSKRRRVEAARPAREEVPCPTCRVSFPKSAYGRNLLAEQLAGALPVPCPLSCGETHFGADLEAHVTNRCRLRRIPCFAGCCSLPQEELAAHILAEHGTAPVELLGKIPVEISEHKWWRMDESR